MSKKKSENPMIDSLKKLRNTWPEGISPVTKVIPDKKKESKKIRNEKHKDKGYYNER